MTIHIFHQYFGSLAIFGVFFEYDVIFLNGYNFKYFSLLNCNYFICCINIIVSSTLNLSGILEDMTN